MCGALVFGERHFRVGAVDGAGRCIDQVLDVMMATAFEDVQEAGDVAADVDVGVLGCVAHAGLGREVAHALRLVGVDEAGAAGDEDVHGVWSRQWGAPTGMSCGETRRARVRGGGRGA